MANQLLDRGLESGTLDGSFWTSAGDAGYVENQQDVVRAGGYALRVSSAHEIGGGNESGQARGYTGTGLVVGTSYTFRIWLKSDSTNVNFSLLVRHYPDGIAAAAVQLDSILASTLPSGWNVYDYTVSINAGAVNTDVVELVPQNQPGLYVDSVNWYVDDCFYGDGMAIKLAELGVGSTVALLKANLGTELGLIDTDRADAITMIDPAAANYYEYPLAEVAGNAAHVEVFEGAIDFGSLEDGSNTDIAAERATYTLPLTIRVTWFNRTGDTPAQMVLRGQRYSAGIYNVLIKDNTVGDSDDATKIGKITSVTPAWQGIAPDGTDRLKGQITLTAEIRCEETQA